MTARHLTDRRFATLNQSWLLTTTLSSVKIIWRGGAVW